VIFIEQKWLNWSSQRNSKAVRTFQILKQAKFGLKQFLPHDP